MKTMFIAAVMAISLVLTAYASRPPDAGSPGWQAIQRQLALSPQHEESGCQSFIPSRDARELLVPDLPTSRSSAED
ncbi:hypothetical protein FVA81_03630 (plasmid) [Rhizobium sp. WL3]|jgi:hypothetical protein|uniref:hypothetical protein n=1 Tax=Rhizobium sp. WL3 TaxID=2603277 RepID=UPI0011C1D8CF|nr:hypothetical protein [Rhizobium sp. WL3]QEE43723.1 hypothetical protein FVA81_03630 [Rhizobium sp. WL3]